MSMILRSFGIWSKSERWKCLIKWVPHDLIEHLKKLSFWSVIISYLMQQGTISPLDCDMQWKVDFIRQPAMVQWLVGLRSSKAPPKAKLAPKNDHGHCLVVCCPSGPLQLSESWRNHYIWELCPANEWDATPAAGTGQQNGPNSSPQQHPTCHTTNTSKLNGLQTKWGARVFHPVALLKLVFL